MAGTAFPVLADAPRRSLRPAPRVGSGTLVAPGIDEIIKKAGLGGQVCFAVADAQTGRLLESRNADRAMPPGSTAKTITAAYALAHLSGEHRFKTRILATGPIVDGRLEGDLILAGGGDPELDSDALGDMARDLKDLGLREITGRFLIFSAALPFIRKIDKKQMDHVSYNPAISGVNLNFNRVHFEWKRQAAGYEIALDARARRFRPQVTSARMRIIDRKLPVYTYSGGGDIDDWTVARSALSKHGARWLPVRNPAVYAGEVFQTLARSYGIILPAGREIKTLPGGTTVLAEAASPPLTEIIRSMLKYSTNLTAEVLGLSTTAARALPNSTLKTSASAMTDWAEKALGLTGSRFTDHSGLGGASRVTAKDFVTALVKIGPEGDVASLMKNIPMLDKKNRILREHPIKVRAKTGTLNFVSALTGFIATEDGRELAFAVLTANLPRRWEAEKSGREIPPGLRSWTHRSRRLQQQLIERWDLLYGA